jgi:cob(I)alamin adenosyltransferase
MLRDNEINRKHKDFLLKVQEDLMVISALLASGSDDLTIKLPSLSDSNINYLEKEIDRLDKNLKPLKSFIISGGDIAI